MMFKAVSDLLVRRLGVESAALGPGAIEAGIAARTRARGLKEAAGYVDLLQTDDAEFQALAEEILVSETWFFRGGYELFAHVAGLVRELAKARTASTAVRILSVPCSSGEEPFSLAIALAEGAVPPELWTIDAADASRKVLLQAEYGRYRDYALRQTEPRLRARYFRQVHGLWEIIPLLREKIHFSSGNAIEPGFLASETPYDVVLCRNLLIYLCAAARSQVILNLERLLGPKAILCVGHAEPGYLMEAGYRPLAPERFMLFERTGPSVQVDAKGQKAIQQPFPHRPVFRSNAPGKQATARFAPAIVPEETRPSLIRARELADAGELSQALHECETLLGRTRPSADLLCFMGLLRQAQQEELEAIRLFEKALYLDPDHSEALNHLLLIRRGRGEHNLASLLSKRLLRTRRGEES